MIVRLLRIVIVLTVFLFSGYSLAETKQEKALQASFLVLADIHFDPFVTCYQASQKPCPLIAALQAAPVSAWSAILRANDTPPVYFQDTNHTLLASSLAAAKDAAQRQQVKFALVLGDFIGHDFRRHYIKYMQDKTRIGYQSFVKKTLAFVTDCIARAFPLIDVYALVGNNDSYQGDYDSDLHGPFFRDTAILWSHLIKTKVNREEMLQHFPQGGYYAVDLPGQPVIRLIMLNSVLFSNKARGKNIEILANQELNWLHRALMSAREKKQRVIIAMHIPEGLDLYAPFRIRLFRLIDLWQPMITTRFQAELRQFSPEVLGIFAGHLHADWFQVLRFDDSSEIPILGVPSVSPIFGNNPRFKIYHYSIASGMLDDFITYDDPLNKTSGWAMEYNFNFLQ